MSTGTVSSQLLREFALTGIFGFDFEFDLFLAGLEVRVAFGDVWKESLTELSGGQRSLLALSLILAMLLFKPAPIYILDEVNTHETIPTLVQLRVWGG